MRLTARMYVMPGFIAGYGAMPLEMRGEIKATPEGSVVRGFVTAPFRLGPLDLVLLTLFAAVVITGIASSGAILSVLLLLVVAGTAMVPIWTLMVRHNQRVALTNVDDLKRMVGSVVSSPSVYGDSQVSDR